MIARVPHAHVEREIVDFHDALAAWLAGGATSALRRIEEAMASHLRLIDLDGEQLDRDRLIAGLRDAGGSRPGLRIAIEDAAVRELAASMWLITFVERHSLGADRRTSAILREDASGPLGLLWVHVHETAIGTAR